MTNTQAIMVTKKILHMLNVKNVCLNDLNPSHYVLNLISNNSVTMYKKNQYDHSSTEPLTPESMLPAPPTIRTTKVCLVS